MDIPGIVQRSQVKQWDRATDVLVIGQGIAGACAALEARRAGADVLVVERASGGGGASALSGGIFYLGGGTAVQKACDVEDDAEQMFRYLAASTNCLDRDALRLFCENSVAHFDWLEALGVPFTRSCSYAKTTAGFEEICLISSGNEKVWPYRDAAKPALRGHKVRGPLEGAGAYAVNPIIAAGEAEGVEALYDTQVTQLVIDASGRVVGARARQFGKDLYIEARRGVVIAAGGFGMNRDMLHEFIPTLNDRAEALGSPYNDGAGVRLGLSAGGAMGAMDGVMPTAAIYGPDVLLKGIMVNKRGQRFIAEDSYHGRSADFTSRQPDRAAYLIVDSETFAYPEKVPHELIDGFETVEEMEARLGVPTGALVKTLEDYNRDAAEGVDRSFYKHPDWLKPLDVGPWAAFDISFDKTTYYFITLGGLRTSMRGEVLDEHGQTVPGLYAAGAATAHIPTSGTGYASGLSLAPGSFFGRQAGIHAARETSQSAREATVA